MLSEQSNVKPSGGKARCRDCERLILEQCLQGVCVCRSIAVVNVAVRCPSLGSLEISR